MLLGEHQWDKDGGICMLRRRNEAPRGLRWGVFSLATIVALVAVSSDPADARRRKRVSHRHAQASAYHPSYAAIIVDGNSGTVLHQENPDALRHPASLTKIMTLYLLFERLDQGKLKLDSPLQISEHAAKQMPTKLGLRAGGTIEVEDAIKGMVTRSANDAAVVVAENLGGSESEFAKLMTAKAQALGMSRTVYKNASGLPDDDQVTTARDQSILGRAIQERYPRYYKYFQTRSFSYHGQAIGNHNRLLGRVDGVDGIKTGYTQASGFNLVTSVHRGNHYLVGVVLGGASAGSRDARMRELISEHIEGAAAKRSVTMIAEAQPQPEPRAAPRPAPAIAEAQPKAEPKDSQRYGLASASSTPVRLDPPAPVAAAVAAPRPAPGSTEPIRPVMVKTLPVRPGPVATAAPAPLHMPAPPPAREPAEATPPGAARPGILGVSPARAVTASIAEPAPSTAPAPQPKPQLRSGWIIQVGAFTAEQEAKQRLSAVQGKASRVLGKADPFTESVLKDGTTYYRARFAGLDKDQAEAACKYLKRNDVDCLTVRN